jgi:hypothetical protein
VIGSDSEERSVNMRRSTRKILCPQPGLILAWAGYKDVAEAMALSLREDPIDLSLARSKVAAAAKERFLHVRSDPGVEHRSDMNEFVLGWYCEAERKPVGLHLPSAGSALWVEQWQYVGNPTAVSTARVVEAAISYVATERLAAEQLSLVTMKVLRDTLACAPANAGIGGDVHLATITATGPRVLEPAELRALNDAPTSGRSDVPSCCQALARVMVQETRSTRDLGLRSDIAFSHGHRNTPLCPYGVNFTVMTSPSAIA